MEQIVGKQSIQFQQAAHILSGAAIVGKKEETVLLANILIKLERKRDYLDVLRGKKRKVICKRKQYLWRLKKPVLKSGSFV